MSSDTMTTYRSMADMIAAEYADELETLEDFTGDGYAPYYSQTEALNDAYTSEVWEAVEEAAEDQGISVMELLTSIDKDPSGIHSITCTCVWIALERAARIVYDEYQARETCSECGKSLDIAGDGYDGRCDDCADKAEPEDTEEA